MQECIPKGVLPKRRHVPWITKKRQKCHTQARNLLYRKSQIAGSTSLFSKYKIARNDVEKGEANLQAGPGNANAKHFWKAVKKLTVNPTQQFPH